MSLRPLALIALALAPLVLLELGLRVLADRDSRWNLRLGSHKRFDPVTQFRNRPHYRFPSGVTTNEHGWLAPEGLSEAVPPDRLRIVYLGDSVAFFPIEDNYPGQVERLLEAEDGIAVETLNTAVPGYASHNARALFESEVARYDADVLFVHVGWNDLGQFGPEGLPYKRHAAGYTLSPLQRGLSGVHVLRLVYQLRRIWRQRQPAVDAPIPAETARLYAAYRPEHFRENLGAILALGKQRYPHVLVGTLQTLTHPDPTPAELARAHFPVGMAKNLRLLDQLVGRYDQTIRSVAAEHDVPVVDLHALFDRPEARRHLTDSCHVDRQGSRLIAGEIAAALRGLLSARPAAAAP